MTGYDKRRTVVRRKVVDNLWAMPSDRTNDTVRDAADAIMSLLDAEVAHTQGVAERRLQELAAMRNELRRMPKNWPLGEPGVGGRHEKVSRRTVRKWLEAYVRAILARQAGL